MFPARRVPRLARLLSAVVPCALFPLASTGRAATVTRILVPADGVGGGSRFRDIDSTHYTTAFSTGYDYADASCSVTCEANDPTNLRGTLTATGLKPNFAYQMKLEGRPSSLWGSDGDDETNARIGYMGRWWCVECNQNITDGDLAYHQAQGHTVIGYLLFDYFVTDGWGAATYDFAADNSFHVLWKTTQRPATSNDSVPTAHTVDAHASYGYTHSYTGSTVQLYGEWEPGRALPGQLVMDAAIYKCRILLTEEDFHETMNWTTVLVNDDLSFVVGQPTAIRMPGFVVHTLPGGCRFIAWQEGPLPPVGYRLYHVDPGGAASLCATLTSDGTAPGRYHLLDAPRAGTYELEVLYPNGRTCRAQPRHDP